MTKTELDYRVRHMIAQMPLADRYNPVEVVKS
jgi:hypothetical protein